MTLARDNGLDVVRVGLDRWQMEAALRRSSPPSDGFGRCRR
jgi:hypothetical protein